MSEWGIDICGERRRTPGGLLDGTHVACGVEVLSKDMRGGEA